MYEGQRKRSNVLVNNEMELSNETNAIETVNEELEAQSENGTVSSNLIEIVEYVSVMKEIKSEVC